MVAPVANGGWFAIPPALQPASPYRRTRHRVRCTRTWSTPWVMLLFLQYVQCVPYLQNAGLDWIRASQGMPSQRGSYISSRKRCNGAIRASQGLHVVLWRMRFGNDPHCCHATFMDGPCKEMKTA